MLTEKKIDVVELQKEDQKPVSPSKSPSPTKSKPRSLSIHQSGSDKQFEAIAEEFKTKIIGLQAHQISVVLMGYMDHCRHVYRKNWIELRKMKIEKLGGKTKAERMMAKQQAEDSARQEDADDKKKQKVELSKGKKKLNRKERRNSMDAM